MNELLRDQQNVVLILGHLGNWEWYGGYFGIRSPFQLYCIYHPLTNLGFDRLMYRIRRRWRTRLIRMKGAARKVQAMNRQHQAGKAWGPFAVGFIADQSPRAENAYWTHFLNQDTAVFWGAERAAKASNMAVVYTSVRRPKRGVYEVNLKLVTRTPNELPEGAISEAFTRLLEEDVRAQPEIWLWAHRRWKGRRPTEREIVTAKD